MKDEDERNAHDIERQNILEFKLLLHIFCTLF
jgi:hypothetical protein